MDFQLLCQFQNIITFQVNIAGDDEIPEEYLCLICLIVDLFLSLESVSTQNALRIIFEDWCTQRVHWCTQRLMIRQNWTFGPDDGQLNESSHNLRIDCHLNQRITVVELSGAVCVHSSVKLQKIDDSSNVDWGVCCDSRPPSMQYSYKEKKYRQFIVNIWNDGWTRWLYSTIFNFIAKSAKKIGASHKKNSFFHIKIIQCHFLYLFFCFENHQRIWPQNL